MKGKLRLNSMRLLESRGIAYEAILYDASGEFHSACDVATLVGEPVEFVYKTLVVIRELPGRGKPLLVMVPAASEIDLRVLARSLGEKKLRMATQREAQSLTGLQVGGIGALALVNKGFEVLLQEDAWALERINVSGGQRGVNLRLSVPDLVAVTGAAPTKAL